MRYDSLFLGNILNSLDADVILVRRPVAEIFHDLRKRDKRFSVKAAYVDKPIKP